jgi:hypothetical protein
MRELELTIVGTATLLIRLGSFTLLTDPNGLHPRERADPAPHLPPLDLVVLSHHHGDLFADIAPGLLDERIPIVTTPRGSRRLRRKGFVDARPLRTWDSQLVVRGDESLRVTALPGLRGPGRVLALLPPVRGSLLELRRPQAAPLNLYITGDTLVHSRLQDIADRYPSIHLARIHLGRKHVAGVLLTTGADQGVEELRAMPPERRGGPERWPLVPAAQLFSGASEMSPSTESGSYAVARSPNDTSPTTTSPSTTGMRRTACSRITSMTSSTSSSGDTDTGSEQMAPTVTSSSDPPSATARTTMSRSVTMPTRW